MHFPENRALILTSQESKIKQHCLHFPRKHFTLFALRCGFCPQRKFPQFSCFEMRPPRQGMLHAYVRTRIQQRFYFFCCHKCHRGQKNESSIRPPIRYCFSKNNGSFSTKQRIVSYKTTCCL